MTPFPPFHPPSNARLLQTMTSHYYHLMSAVNAFLFKNSASPTPYPQPQVDALTAETDQLKSLVDDPVLNLGLLCNAVAAATQALEATPEAAALKTAWEALDTAAGLAYVNDPARMGTPEFIPHNPLDPDIGDWGFRHPCLGRSIYEAIKALHMHSPLPGVVGQETAESLFRIQRLMRPEAPPGGDDPSVKPCWPSCLVSSSSSSS